MGLPQAGRDRVKLADARALRMFLAKRRRLDPLQAEWLRRLVLTLGLPPKMTAEMFEVIVRFSGAERFRFTMIDEVKNLEVIDYLLSTPRPKVAVRLWALLLCSIQNDQGEIAATRQELAEVLRVDPRVVSRIMADLARKDWLIREERGRGVCYFVNPRIATRADRDARMVIQAAAPLPLELTGGDKPH